MVLPVVLSVWPHLLTVGIGMTLRSLLTGPLTGLILSLDGGGVRGIIPLVLLEQLEQQLVKFGLPLREYFDFVCGTSASRINRVSAWYID